MIFELSPDGSTILRLVSATAALRLVLCGADESEGISGAVPEDL